MEKTFDTKKQYNFYGWDTAGIFVENPEYPGINTPCDLYDALCEAWCVETCADRFRPDWSEENRTLGQCSITSFLAQDIFGGKVYGIQRPDGNCHCYNVVGDSCFDLTSEQFGEGAKELVYADNPEQHREDHFARDNKKQRYELLKQRLKEKLMYKNPLA